MLKETLRSLVQSNYFTLLIFIIMLDIFTGVASNIVNKTKDDNFGVQGVFKNITVILIIIIMGLYATEFNYENVYLTVTVFFIIQYLIGIVNTCSVLGVPIPKFVIEKLNLLGSLKQYEKETDINDDDKNE